MSFPIFSPVQSPTTPPRLTLEPSPFIPDRPIAGPSTSQAPQARRRPTFFLDSASASPTHAPGSPLISRPEAAWLNAFDQDESERSFESDSDARRAVYSSLPASRSDIMSAASSSRMIARPLSLPFARTPSTVSNASDASRPFFTIHVPATSHRTDLSPFDEARSWTPSWGANLRGLASRAGPGMDVDPVRHSMQMETLMDIYRVLYRGRGADDGMGLRWTEQGPEIRRIMDERIEPYCRYDHPLLRLPHRDAFFTHFALVNLVASPCIPTLRPGTVFHIVSSSAKIVCSIIGLRKQSGKADVEAASPSVAEEGGIAPLAQPVQQGPAEPTVAQRPGIGARVTNRAVTVISAASAPTDKPEYWWRPWDIVSSCHEVGGVDMPTGKHYAMIEHVVTLTIFPSIVNSSRPAKRFRPDQNLGSDRPNMHQLSFSGKCARLVTDEISYLLRWDLPVSTIIHLNEAGRATFISDTVSVRDVIETFVPFARRISRLSRRMTGALTSTLGKVAVLFIPTAPALPASATPSQAVQVPATPIGLGLTFPSERVDEDLPAALRTADASQVPLPPYDAAVEDLIGDSAFFGPEEVNSLGLQGVGGQAAGNVAPLRAGEDEKC